MATKVFHANADIDTNHYASDLIGSQYVDKLTVAKVVTKEVTVTETVSVELEKIFRPEDFVPLKTGSPSNNYVVEGIIHRQGDPMFFGKNFLRMGFDQTI